MLTANSVLYFVEYHKFWSIHVYMQPAPTQTIKARVRFYLLWGPIPILSYVGSDR